MVKIFISYRRGDSGWAGRIQQGLQQKRGLKDIFRDTQSILPGEDFPNRIQSAIEAAEIILVLIGQEWKNRIGDLHKTTDQVRRELQLALDLNKLIITITVESIKSPTPGELPQEIRALTQINEFRLIDPEFDTRIDELAKTIRGAPKRYSEKRKLMTINGLRTMLNLAWIHLNETVPSIDDIEVLVEYLVPDVFVSKLDLAEIPASKLSRFHLEDNNLLPN